jgi:hypothetical protein
VNNFLAEPNETVILTLAANAAYVLTATIPERTATVTIADDEPTISVTASDSQAAETAAGEPANTGTFRISRQGNTTNALTVYFTRTGTATLGATADYTLSVGTTAVIPVGEDYVDITVTPVDNNVPEPNEMVILTLTANAAYNLTSTVSQRTATVTIRDDIDVVGTWTGTWYKDVYDGPITIILRTNNTLSGTSREDLSQYGQYGLSGTVAMPFSGTYSYDSVADVLIFESQGATTILGVPCRYWINGSANVSTSGASGDYWQTSEAYIDGLWKPMDDNTHGTFTATHP